MQGTEKVSLNIHWIRLRSNNIQIFWNIRQIFRNIGQIFWNVSQIFWNSRQIFWNIRHAFWNIRQIFWNTRQLFWNIRQILQIYWLQWRVPILFAANFLQCWVMQGTEKECKYFKQLVHNVVIVKFAFGCYYYYYYSISGQSCNAKPKTDNVFFLLIVSSVQLLELKSQIFS